MNIILCVIAASILVNVAKSGKSVEEEMAEEVKRVLEQFKIKADSMEQKLAGHSQLQNSFKTAVTDAGKIIETLNDTLKVFEQLRKEETESKTPKGKLKYIKKKLPEVITTLEDYESEAKPSDSFADSALKYANQLNEALEAALKVETKNINIIDLRKKAVALNAMIYNIGLYVKDAKYPVKAKELQEPAYRITLAFEKTLKELQV